MRRRVLLCLTLISLSACNGDKIGQPISIPVSPPSRSISDGTYALGNPDFFFLPPMVKNPSSSPNWTAGAFNGTLHPVVHICEMTGTTEATATLTTTCSDLATSVSLTDEQYSVNWPVPSSSTVFYRLSVVVGTKVLGWADVETATNASQLKNVTTGEYVPLVDGRTLPVKFRIERYALCDVPGTGPCASSTVDLSSGGTVSTTVVANGLPAGITIPAGAGTTSTTITVQSCPDLPLDSPLFGTCVRITADPALPPSGFAAAATVFICDVNDASVGSRIVDHAQAERITIHRLDPGVEGPVITALPHAPACGEPIASAEGSMRGLLAALRRGSVGAAAHEVLSMLAPKPLYAARFIDLGGGGFTSELSDFQFALPSKMEQVEGTDGRSVLSGTSLSPSVKVTDLGGEPVAGAIVHFFSSTGTGGTAVPTGADGMATVPWVISSGGNVLSVSGRGIAAPNSNGPRSSPGSEVDDIVDPFQPIQTPFDPGFGGVPQEVAVRTGLLTFTVSGYDPDIVVFNDFNVFDDLALADPNNQRFVRNLAAFTAGSRAAGNAIVMDVSRAGASPSCFGAAAQGVVGALGYTFTTSSTAIGPLPANVRTVILCLPRSSYGPVEINNLKQFVAEGGRVIFVGEHISFYGTTGFTAENKFFADMGAATTVTPAFIDCVSSAHPAYWVLSPPSLRATSLTAGMSQVTMACSSTLTLGPADVALYYDDTNSEVLAAVSRVSITPMSTLSASTLLAPAQRSNDWVPTADPAGRPIVP